MPRVPTYKVVVAGFVERDMARTVAQQLAKGAGGAGLIVTIEPGHLLDRDRTIERVSEEWTDADTARAERLREERGSL